MRRALYGLGFLVWTAVVFVVTFRLTFPVETVIERIRYEVPNVMGRSVSAEIGDAAPWWVGVSLDDVKLHQLAGVRAGFVVGEEEDPVPPVQEEARLLAAFENISVRASAWSLLRRQPYLTSVVSFVGGKVVHATIGTRAADNRLGLQDLALDGSVPLADLFGLMGQSASAQGDLTLDVDLEGGEVGIRDASGRASVKSRQVTISDIEVPGMGPLGMDVVISEVNLVMDVVNGRATVTDGKIVSDLATISISGEFTLRDPIDRTGYDLEFVISDLAPQLNAFTGLLGDAKQPNGSFLYSCRGILSRPTSRDCSSRARSASRTTSPRMTPPGVPPAGLDGAAPGVPVTGPAPRDPLTEEERERRRQEIRERLRRGRDRPTPGSSSASAEPSDDPPPPPPPDEPPSDEEPPAEGDEEPID